MISVADAFQAVLAPVLRRYCAQNGLPPPSDAALAALAARLAALVAERGLPPPLAPGEAGAPKEMNEAECAPLVARVLGDADPALAEPLRQALKACFYPEFTVCRDSFCAESPDGSCRRQELARARKRISGSHCVDCPHWLALEPDAHAALLRQHWKGDAAEFTAQREVFLPEDFRALRRWVRAHARSAVRR